MKKLTLSAIALYLQFLTAFSQQFYKEPPAYSAAKLKLDEVNLVSGYYTQNGQHSAVTGGIGTQHLSDISNVIELKFIKKEGEQGKKITLEGQIGIDHHSAASQAYISKSGASSPKGTRIYPSLNWSVESANRTTFGLGASASAEYNYHSLGANISIGKKTRNGNTEVNLKGQAFIDQVGLIQPSELANTSINSFSGGSRGFGWGSGIPTSPRNTFSGALTISQVLNKRTQISLIAEPTFQQGLLSLPFHRVYFTTGAMKVEKLPDQRQKWPVAVRANYFIGDKFIIRSYYRYFEDNWGVKAHTVNLELPYKISAFLSVAPFWRFYDQTGSSYFAPYKQHKLSDRYYTSNYDLSSFHSNMIGLNLRYVPKTGTLIFDLIEIRYAHYEQTTGLSANNIGLNFRFK